jgi:hypothetical protein
MFVCVCVCVCARARVRACVRARERDFGRYWLKSFILKIELLLWSDFIYSVIPIIRTLLHVIFMLNLFIYLYYIIFILYIYVKNAIEL